MVTFRQDDAHALPQNYSAALGLFGNLVRQVEPAQWWLPTPCDRWTVRDLVNHVTVQQLWVPPLLSGASVAEFADRLEGDRLGDVPALAWKRAATEAEEAVHAKRALDGSVTLWNGPARTAHLCSQLAMDTVVHAWDLARSVGAEEKLPDALVAFALRELSGYADRLSASGLFAPSRPVPAASNSQTRLLALTGRNPDAAVGGSGPRDGRRGERGAAEGAEAGGLGISGLARRR